MTNELTTQQFLGTQNLTLPTVHEKNMLCTNTYIVFWKLFKKQTKFKLLFKIFCKVQTLMEKIILQNA